jgi:hypothetical protein
LIFFFEFLKFRSTPPTSKRLYNLCDIKVHRMDTMNQEQGTIFSRNMITEKEEDILEALKTYRCTKVERMEAFRDGQRWPNGIHILSFATRELPDNVLGGFERYSVKRFYPNPLRCRICCQFGHTKNWCRKNIRYLGTGMCLSPKKCVNCNPPDDNHCSYDRDCQVRVAEMAVIRIKTDLDISYGIARKKLEE